VNIYKKSDIPEHLQKYFEPAEIGLEQTPEEYIAAMVEVFRCVRDVLADDGTIWVNMGDSYATSGGAPTTEAGPDVPAGWTSRAQPLRTKPAGSVKTKDLYGFPWMLAFALRADGWYLRQDIIWHKPNPMPESVRDRCTKAHEYVFLLSKSPRYFIDPDGMKEPVRSDKGNANGFRGGAYVNGATFDNTAGGNRTAVGNTRSARDNFKREGSKREQAIPGQVYGTHRPDREESTYDLDRRNRRSVWTVATRPYKGAHFATFPPDLIKPCILAGSRPGDIVLDPFMGSGTTAAVALQHGRQYLGCELNPAYQPLQDARIATSVGPLFA
jgi:DNA modification methylase